MLNEYIRSLEQLIELLIVTSDLVEDKEAYKEQLGVIVNEIEYGINLLFQLFSDEEIAEAASFDKIYLLQILQDFINAMENEDKVLLIDVLRFGLCTEFQKACIFLQEINEELEEE